MNRNYTQAGLCLALGIVGAVIMALEWHYHRSVSPVPSAWTGLCLVGVGLALRAK